MELNIMERLLILNLDTLPKTGNIITLKIKQQLMSDVGFTEKEVKEFNIRQEDGNVFWSPEAKPVEIEVGPEAVKLLITALESSESLNDMYIPLYDRLKEVK